MSIDEGIGRKLQNNGEDGMVWAWKTRQVHLLSSVPLSLKSVLAMSAQ